MLECDNTQILDWFWMWKRENGEPNPAFQLPS